MKQARTRSVRARDLRSGQWVVTGADRKPMKVLAVSRPVPGVCRFTLYAPVTAGRSCLTVPLTQALKVLED